MPVYQMKPQRRNPHKASEGDKHCPAFEADVVNQCRQYKIQRLKGVFMGFFDFSGGGNMDLGSVKHAAQMGSGVLLGSKDSTWRHENKRGQDKAF